MSHQKVVIFVCLVAVSMVSAQNMDPVSCGQKSQQAIMTYAQNFQNQMSKFQQAMVSGGNSQFNPDQMMQETQQITDQIMSMADTSSGINPSTMMTTYTKIIQMSMSMVTKYAMNPNLSMAAVNNGGQLMTGMLQSQTQLVQDMSQACMPRSY